ncbi:MAG TPA: ABC transporter ATP-binding protein [Tianweitania sediminis]|jgi:spermidine/putrescine ABC transporter ATP-binding subunit|nr:ABC transporter ATP-binding protein [Tianweitania sediminis]
MAEGLSSVRIENVSKSFGSLQVLKSTTLEIASGEFFSLLGPSGCGKTTLLNILGGMEIADEGRVIIGNSDVTYLPPERRPTNMVFQSYAIFPHLSVAKNIGYGLRSRKLGREEAFRRVNRALELVHLGGMGDRDPSELSGGQRQRVALARALVLEPKVLLLDESLAALDRRLREAMQTELRELQRKVGITFVFVTHDQDEAMAMSDRIAVMGAGGILQVAKPTELYHRPINRQVAEFIGSINLLPVQAISETSDGLALNGGSLGAFFLNETSQSGQGIPNEVPAMLALRPESIELHSERPPETVNAIPGDVLEHVFLGDRSFLRIRVDNKTEPMIAACSKERDWSQVAKGERVWMIWHPRSGQLLPDA